MIFYTHYCNQVGGAVARAYGQRSELVQGDGGVACFWEGDLVMWEVLSPGHMVREVDKTERECSVNNQEDQEQKI